MRMFPFLLAILFLQPSELLASCNSSDLIEARTRFENAERLQRQGLSSARNVERARQALLETQFCASDILVGEYCTARARSIHQDVVRYNGGRGIHRRVSLLEMASTLRQLCRENPAGTLNAAVTDQLNTRCSQADVEQSQIELRNAQEIFAAGNTTISRVHYFEDSVLETKLCAGQIRLTGFCRLKMNSHRERLQRLEGRNFTEKRALLNQISDTYLRCHQALASHPQVLKVCSDDLLAEAREHLSQSRTQRQRGLATNSFLSESRLALLNTQLCNQSVTVANYCQSDPPRTHYPADYRFPAEDTVARDFFLQKVLCHPHRRATQHSVEPTLNTAI